ncbi:MAG: glycoside hydrolase family 2 TIM barrel-domain containing protein [Ferruginibacter sp.]
MDRREALSGLGLLIGGSMLGTPPLYTEDPADTNTETGINNKSVRKRKILSHNWKFQVDIKNIGEEERWFNLAHAKCDWANVFVPPAWDCYEEALREYEGVGWYMTTIGPGDFISNERTEIVFSRVMYYSKVWLNGEFLGENIGGYLPFDFNISPFLKAGASNTLVIRVDNKPRLEWLPASKQIEWIQYGGILEKVELQGSANIYIRDLVITTTLSNGTAVIGCAVNIVNETAAPAKMELHIEIARAGSIARKTVAFETPANTNRKLKIDIGIEKADLWSPDTPAMYTAFASIKNKDLVIDDLAERFGIRQISVEGNNLLLNGKIIHIKGVNRYDDYGRLGTTVPENLLREELALMKSIGINFIRMHYPQSSVLLSLYDEYGFMMMEEVPLNWWGVKWFGETTQSLDILQFAKPALTKMIARDKNHPSIIFWSMCNECVTDSEVGIAVMRDLLTQAKSLDPTRLVTYVMNDDPATQPALDKADIICINKYYGTLQGQVCRHISDIEELGYIPFVSNMTKHRKDVPGKPMIITEFGTQGIKTMHGDLYYSEEFQSAYIERIWDGINNVPGLSGGVLWCWADYYHRKYLITYAAFGPYGVVTTERKPKKSLDALTRMYGGSRKIKN